MVNVKIYLYPYNPESCTIGQEPIPEYILNNSRNTFSKEERLCSKSRIEALFKKGSSKSRYPIKLMQLQSPVNLKFPAQVMFVVPKRNFKKAHDRNLIRRRMREIYRQHKQELYTRLRTEQLLLVFIYFSKKSESFDGLKKSMLDLMQNMQIPRKD